MLFPFPARQKPIFSSHFIKLGQFLHMHNFKTSFSSISEQLYCLRSTFKHSKQCLIMKLMKYNVITIATISLLLVIFISGCSSTSNSTNTTIPATTIPTTTENLMITIYCTSNNCSPQQISAGAGTLSQGCYRGKSLCTSKLPSESTTTVQSQAYSIDIMNFAFQPSELTISVGDTVKWTNQDSASHTVVLDAGNTLSGFGSTNMAQGQSYSYTFTTAGNFTYHCGIHASMKGNIIVG